MTSEAVTLGGYIVIAVTVVALDVLARRSSWLPTFTDALDRALGFWPSRLAVQAAWLWTGWHVFVRVDWR